MIYGRPIQIVGAGPWYTRFQTPQDQSNTDAGFTIQNTANGTTVKNFAFFGNYIIRNDGPGKVFDLNGVSGDTIDNIWVEHTVCMYWGVNTDNMKITNSCPVPGCVPTAPSPAPSCPPKTYTNSSRNKMGKPASISVSDG